MNYRNDFPLLKRGIVYFDNAATSLKPQPVIDAVVDFYTNHTANIHRGIHTLSEEATELYEGSKEKVASFINSRPEDLVYVKNATEGLNFAAYMIKLEKGDRVLTSVMEHHSNLLPWYLMRSRGIKVDFVDIDEHGKLKMEELTEKARGAKVLAFSHASNVLGTINPIEEITRIAHENGALSVVDAAQSVPHLKVDTKKIDADFLAFSGHKMLAPSGSGALVVKEDLVKDCTPPLAGGGTIHDVTLKEVDWAPVPERFEGGTPNIEGSIGLGAAAEYLKKIGMDNIRAHEVGLLKHFFDKTENLPIMTYGPEVESRTGLVAFNLEKIHAHDVADFLNGRRIAVRSGKHCAHPLHQCLGIPASSRASFHIYNTKEEIDRLFSALSEALEVFS